MNQPVKSAIRGDKIMKSLIMKIPFRILAGVIALAFVGANEEVQAQNYYWKDYNNNGQWDWSNNQWYGSSQGSNVGAPQADGGAIIWFENMGNQTTTINSGTGFSGGWFKLNSVYAAANSTGKNYIVNVKSGETGIELYNKIETISGGGTLSFANIDVQLGANAEINADGNTLTLGGLRMNGKTLNSWGGGSLNIQGAIIGTGTYNIQNRGTIVTYSGSSQNTFSGITTVGNSSQLRLNKSANTAAISGQLVINSGGTVRTDAAGQLNNQFVTVNGTLNLNNQNQSLALTGTSSGSVTLGSGTITINNMNSDSFAGIISGTGGLTKTGTGTQTLSGGNTFTGKVQINQGTLSIGAESGLGGTVASLTADQLQFGGGTLSVNTGFAMSNNRGITLNSGGGTIDVASSQTLGIGGVITGANNLTKSGSGTLTLSGANNYSGATAVNAGLLKVVSGGSISSSTTVNTGGTLDVDGTAGSVQVNSGGLLKGSGSAGAVTFQSGSLLNPGNSPGTLTAASATVLGGSTYNWEISALTGTAGTDWDLLSVGGLLDMSGVTSGNKWNLVVTGDSFAGWTGTDSYSYVFAQAANLSLASGFSTSAGTDVTSLFNITTSGISSKPNASFNPNGDFKVVVGSSNSNTTLNLMAVPEPSSGSLLLAGIGSLIVLRRFRKKA